MSNFLANNANEELSLKQRINNSGHTCERVVLENGFKGMRVLKDGVQTHKSQTQSYDTSMELVRILGY
jgi:hypothetical protein